MAKCKDCLHYKACLEFSKFINCAVDVEKGCKHFSTGTSWAEVVRCKDCKHWQESVDGVTKWCPLLMDKETKADDFCSFGEWRDSDGCVL